jgi:hypothetical protein
MGKTSIRLTRAGHGRGGRVHRRFSEAIENPREMGGTLDLGAWNHGLILSVCIVVQALP